MRTDFHRSRLVRLLDRWTPTDAPRRDLAERLAGWLSVRDAIALHEAQAAIADRDEDGAVGRASARQAEGSRVEAGPTASRLAVEWSAELGRLRTTLEGVIGADDTSALRAPDAGFAPWHHRYLQHQRRMADLVGSLRNRVRQAMGTASTRLAQLTLLDATLEQLLGRREQQALSTVPAFLRARYEQLQEQHAGQLLDLFPPAPDAWLHAFERDFREALRAELELRLQPVAGLIEACRDDSA